MQDSEQKPEGQGLLEKSVKGGTWLSIGYFIQKALSFVSFLLLARLLPPEAFGVIALIFLVPKFLEAVTDTGLGTAIIQRPGDIRPYLSPIWTIGVLKAGVVAVIMGIIGPAVARFYQIEYATLAVQLGGLSILILNFSNIGETYLFRELQFKKIVIRNLVRDAAYIVVSLSVAFVYRSYWALFWGTLASYAAQSMATYLLQSYRPRFTRQFQPLRDLINYSKWIVGQGWLMQLHGFLETSIVAKSTTTADLGLYTKAKSVASVAPGFLGPMIKSISFPAYAKIQTEQGKIVTGLTHTFHLVCFFMVPATAAIAFAGGKLILILLGQDWVGMTNAFRVLLIYFFLGLASDIAQPFFNAIGKPQTQVRFDSVKLIGTVILLIPLTHFFGISGSALSVLLGSLPTLVLNLRAMIRLTGIRARDILKTVLAPLCLTLTVLLPFMVWKDMFLSQPNAALVGLSGAAGMLYLLLTYLADRFWHIGPYQTIRLIIRHLPFKRA